MKFTRAGHNPNPKHPDTPTLTVDIFNLAAADFRHTFWPDRFPTAFDALGTLATQATIAAHPTHGRRPLDAGCAVSIYETSTDPPNRG